MQTQIEETFEILAPVDTVWVFLMNPQRMVECLPDAELEEMADGRTLTQTLQGYLSPREDRGYLFEIKELFWWR